MKFNSTTATALGVGIVGGIATMFYTSIGTILIWAGFVAWACFFAIGGDKAALKTTIICNAFGVVIASLTAIMILAVPLGPVLGDNLWTSLAVFISIVVYISLSRIPAFSNIPAATFGYATAFAYLVQTPGMFSLEALTSLSFANSMIVLPVSMTLGALFGMASGKLSAALTEDAPSKS